MTKKCYTPHFVFAGRDSNIHRKCAGSISQCEFWQKYMAETVYNNEVSNCANIWGISSEVTHTCGEAHSLQWKSDP
jgi:hypothetical protein